VEGVSWRGWSAGQGGAAEARRCSCSCSCSCSGAAGAGQPQKACTADAVCAPWCETTTARAPAGLAVEWTAKTPCACASNSALERRCWYPAAAGKCSHSEPLGNPVQNTVQLRRLRHLYQPRKAPLLCRAKSVARAQPATQHNRHVLLRPGAAPGEKLIFLLAPTCFQFGDGVLPPLAPVASLGAPRRCACHLGHVTRAMLVHKAPQQIALKPWCSRGTASSYGRDDSRVIVQLGSTVHFVMHAWASNSPFRRYPSGSPVWRTAV
jgi:hypothetical protein